MARGLMGTAPSKYPGKAQPTLGIDNHRMVSLGVMSAECCRHRLASQKHADMRRPAPRPSRLQDAATYLHQVQSRAANASTRTRSSSESRSSSLISYASTARPRSDSDTDSTDSERSTGWRGLNSPMPLPSSVSASRPPTVAFDVDYVPDPEDPYSLRHSEYGHDLNPAHRTTSQHRPGTSLKASDEEPSVWTYILTYLNCEQRARMYRESVHC